MVFKGKTGIAHDVKIESRKLARTVMQCRLGKYFQYVDENGDPCPIDSGGHRALHDSFVAETCPTEVSAKKELINKALDEAAKHLGNIGRFAQAL